MNTIRVLSVLGVLCICPAAYAQSIKTITTQTSRGTATTEITRNGNTVTATTQFEPSKPAYQPMGGGAGGYKPLGGSGYKPMGN